MKVPNLRKALSRIRKGDDVEVLTRYVDMTGAPQTVPIVEVIEETPLGDEGQQARRVILIAGAQTS